MFWVGFVLLSKDYPQLRADIEKFQKYMEETELQEGEIFDISHIYARTGIPQNRLEQIFEKEMAYGVFKKVYRLKCPITGEFLYEQDEPFIFPLEKFCDLHGEDHTFTEEDTEEGYQLLLPGITGVLERERKPVAVIPDRKGLTIEDVRKAIREEVSPIVRDSAKEIIFQVKVSKEEVKKQIQEYHAELLQEIQALNDAQLHQFKELISKNIEEDIEKIEDEKKKKETKRSWKNIKRALSAATDVMTVVLNIMAIYSHVKAGSPGEAIKVALDTIKIVLTKIQEVT